MLINIVKHNKRVKFQGLSHISTEILVKQCDKTENKISRLRHCQVQTLSLKLPFTPGNLVNNLNSFDLFAYKVKIK